MAIAVLPLTPKKRVLLIGWDSADWKIINPLLAEGGMNGLRALMEGGNHGNLATLEPQLSPMLWSSIATGKMAYHHGVEGFTEVDPVSGQVVPVSAATSSAGSPLRENKISMVKWSLICMVT